MNSAKDIIIIGGGPSGLMAAAAAGAAKANLLLLDKGDKLGRKLAISGGGRCNVTNNKNIDELISNIPGNGRFLFSALASFDNKAIIRFFEEMGIRLKEEDNGRMFPVSNKAKSVVDALVNRVHELGAESRIHTPVRRVLFDRENMEVTGVELFNGDHIAARCVIIATGGKSVPRTGSTGDGYAWAQDAGHTITRLFPTEVPLTSCESFVRNRELQGLSLRDVSLTVWNAKGNKIIAHRGDMIFTHYGLSGPICLRCSQFVVKELAKSGTGNIVTTIDLSPDKTSGEIYEETLAMAKNEPRKAIKNVLKAYLSERIVPILLQKAGLNDHLTYHNIPKQNWLELSKLIKAFPVAVNGTLSLEEAFVTGGGVNLKEIDPKTMGSKLMKGLYFCGEILDIHGYTGGYNITAAFVTGHTAGQNAASYAKLNKL